jgi:methyl-accepting chemotaxis protein
MQQGESANATVSSLVDKAQNGQKDMENVQKGMQSIAEHVRVHVGYE